MPRVYKRKTNRRSYTDQQLEQALQLCRSGQMTVQRSAAVHSIPRETLRDHLSGHRGKRPTVGGGGRSCDLSPKDEHELAKCLKIMSSSGFGLSRMEVLDIVQQYVQKNKLRIRFKHGRPGEDWWLSFKRRHNLSIKKPEALEHVRRLQSSDPFLINGFYDLLESTIRELKLQNKPQCIWKCDETSFCHDPSRTKVITERNKSCHRYTAGTGRENTTVLACVNAAGHKLPPLIIYKAKNMWNKWMPEDSIFPGTAFTSTPKGWMTSEVFSNWFREQFLKNIGDMRPALLIYDGHVTHISPEVISCAQDNNVTLLKLPAHTSHILQPLDVSCFKGLKSKWDSNLVKWQRSHVGMRPSKENFAKLLGETWIALTQENIQSGFRKTGIFDFSCEKDTHVNRNAISRSIFDPNALSRYDQATAANTSVPLSSIEDMNKPASTTTFPVAPEPEKDALNIEEKNSFEDLLLATVKQKKASEDGSRKKKKIGGTAEILTTHKNKIICEAKLTKNDEKKQSYSESSDSTLDVGQIDNDSLVDSTEEVEQSSDKENQNLTIGDFILVRFPTKTTVRYFVGQILQDSFDEYEIKFLRCKSKIKGAFKWPPIDDICNVSEQDIIKKLPPPYVDRWGVCVFNIDFGAYNMS